MALELHEDGLTLYYGSLGASDPLRKHGECADRLHDSQEVPGREGNALRGRCGGARPSYI